MRSIDRRQFIKKTGWAIAGAAGAPLFVPASALGRDGGVAPSERITMGCIGLGGQGTHNMRAFLQNPAMQIVALCDVEKESNRYRGATFGLEPARRVVNEYYGKNKPSGSWEGPDLYSDFRELVARQDIDTVTVCTPDHWHGVIAAMAATSGKDIYCEKPLTNTVAEGRAVCDAVQRHGRVLQTGSHERSGGNARFACELVRNGRIGKLHTVRINLPVDEAHHNEVKALTQPQPITAPPETLDYDMWMGPTPVAPYIEKRVHFWWRFVLDFGGGEMTDRGVHVIDLAQLGLDADKTGPIEYDAWGRAPEEGIYNVCMEFGFECKYANGVRMIGTNEGPRGLKFEGTDGWVFIHIHGGRLEAEPASLLKEIIYPNEIHVGRSPGHHQNFIDAVKTRGETVATAETGHRTATLCHLLNISMQLGRPLKWDPVEENVIGDDRANAMLARPMRSPWRI